MAIKDQWAAIRTDNASEAERKYNPLPGGAARITWDLKNKAGQLTGFGHVLIRNREHAEHFTHKNYPPDVINAARDYLNRGTK